MRGLCRPSGTRFLFSCLTQRWKRWAKFFRPCGAGSFPTETQGLRPGLRSDAAPRLIPFLRSAPEIWVYHPPTRLAESSGCGRLVRNMRVSTASNKVKGGGHGQTTLVFTLSFSRACTGRIFPGSGRFLFSANNRAWTGAALTVLRRGCGFCVCSRASFPSPCAAAEAR